MTVTIPVWLLWAVSGLVTAVLFGIVGFFAIIGWQMRKVFSK
jgi:hypothetical protein